MNLPFRPRVFGLVIAMLAAPALAPAQDSPYDVFPAAEPPYYRVQYEASEEPDELAYAVNYTVWMPDNVKLLRGVIVHQHGCGTGSCKSGLTGAYDLHWQALARKHKCALLAPSYAQPEGADCQRWCDPRNGSAKAFRRCLVDLGEQSGHPELAEVPWALWGHSGGGTWAGGMVLLYPERVAAAWLRSGVPSLAAVPDRPSIQPFAAPTEAVFGIPILCNLGTKEGVTVTDGRFAGVWPRVEQFFRAIRGQGGLIGVAIDPRTGHECGNQRYLAIPWLDACLQARLPETASTTLKPMPSGDAWLAPPTGPKAVPIAEFTGDPATVAWLPNRKIAEAWMQYVEDTEVADPTAPPAPTNLRVQGDTLRWESQADLESGLARFIIQRDGKLLARVPERDNERFGRPLFQGLQYSDTPEQPLSSMEFVDTTAGSKAKRSYRVIAVNTAGLRSEPAVYASE